MEFSNSLSIILVILSLMQMTECASKEEYSDYCPGMNKRTYEYSRPQSEPVFGTDEVEPFVMEDQEKFENFYSFFHLINRNYLRDTLLNHLDTYIQIYDDFSKASYFKKNFTKFYKKYQIKFKHDVTMGSQVLAVMKKISGHPHLSSPNNTQLRRSMYLAAAYKASPEERYAEYNKHDRENEKPNRKYFFFVVGILRIIFNQRKGYIMFDTESNAVYPQIIMEDGQEPYPGYSGSENTKTLDDKHYRTFQNNKKYIYNLRFEDEDSYQEDLMKYNHPKIIYVGHPYCSFLDTSEKYCVYCKYKDENPSYNWRKELSKRDMNGKILGGIIGHEYRYLGKLYLEIFIINNTLYTEKRDGIDFDPVEVLRGEIPKKEKGIYYVKKLAELFDWVPSKVGYKLGELARALKDDDFHNQFCDIKKP